MARIFVNYGQYQNYRLEEVPAVVIEHLARRYPLDAKRYTATQGVLLLTTVDIHQELSRRRSGGEVAAKHLSQRELVKSIILNGYEQLSKEFPSNHNGNKEARQRLDQARDQLLKFINGLAQDNREGDIIVTNDKVKLWSRKPEPEDFETSIDNDALPF
jgi:hypothetical protein